jgi:catechol 2,3-dioxygenase-like lactoylglutathione lyase family enzyme
MLSGPFFGLYAIQRAKSSRENLMIGYVTVGTNDLERASGFYDRLLAVVGAGRFMQEESFVAWAVSPDKPALSVTRPFDGNPATVGNGMMVALAVDSKEMVHRVYDKAIELGGSDEGPPGPRGDFFYAGYFRDLDGNKLNVFWFTRDADS